MVIHVIQYIITTDKRLQTTTKNRPNTAHKLMADTDAKNLDLDTAKEEVRLLRLQIETLQARIRHLEAERRHERLSDVQEQPRPWNCTACTYENKADCPACVVCSGPKCSEKWIQTWACHVCTYENEDPHTKCEVCEAEKQKPPGSTAAHWDPVSVRPPGVRPRKIVCDGC